METPQVTDPERISKAANALALVVEKDWEDGRKGKLPTLLLRALCRLAAENPGSSIEGWEPSEIAAVMTELGALWRNIDDDTARYRVNNHWKKLTGLWEIRRESVLERLAGDEIDVEPLLEKREGGGHGNKTCYFLQFIQLPPSSRSVDPPPKSGEPVTASIPQVIPERGHPAPTIRYYRVPLRLRGAKDQSPFEGFSMSGFLLFMLLNFGAFTIIAAVAVLIWFLDLTWDFTLQFLSVSELPPPRFDTDGSEFVVLLVLIYFAYVFVWVLRIMTNRVNVLQFSWRLGARDRMGPLVELRPRPARATRPPLPTVTPPVTDRESQNLTRNSSIRSRILQQYKRTQDISQPRPGPEDDYAFYVSRYVADCPICGVKDAGRSAINPAPGGWEFHGRVVGRCAHAPQEHVWSFDHITRIGRFLR